MEDDYLERAIRNYNPDEDVKKSGGAYGMRLADMMFARGIKRFSKPDSNLETIARIALTRFPELQKGETIYDREISERLREIRQTGYNVPPYSHLSKDKKWKLLRGIQGEIEAKAREQIPEVLRGIYEDNRRRIEDAEFLR